MRAAIGLILLLAMGWSAVGQEEFSFPAEFALRAQLVPEGPSADGTLELLREDGTSLYRARWDGKEFRVFRSRDGQLWRVPWPLSKEGSEVYVLRDGWVLSISDGQQVRLRIYDGTWQEAKGRLAAQGARWQGVTLQPIEPLYFTDDFTRAEMNAVWRPVGGIWSLTGPETTRINPRLSANPFALRVRAEGEAFLQAGEWFWGNARLAVSVRPQGGTVGLCLAFRDSSQHLRLLWEPAPRGRLRLEEVRGGQARSLAEWPSGYIPDQWYRLEVRFYDGYAEAWVDGERRLVARSNLHGLGGIALYARGSQDTLWDDVLLEDWRERRFEGSELTALMSSGDLWGRADWRNFGGEVSLDLTRVAVGELGWGVSSPQQGLFLVWQGGGRQAGLEWREGKERRTLARFALQRPGSENLLTFLVRPGWIAVQQEGRTLAEAWLERPVEGFVAGGDLARRNGLRAWGITFPLFLPPPPEITEQFTREATMAAWATPAGLWTRRDEDIWYRGALLGDGGFVFRPSPATFPWKEVRFHATPEASVPSYHWLLEPREGVLRLQLLREGTPVGQTEIPRPTEGEPLILARWGQHWVVLRGEEPRWAWRDPQPLAAPFAALRANLPLELERIQFLSDHLEDETFSHAPVAWWMQKGEWEVRARWPCYPDWTWFGASDLPPYQNPVLWSKHVYAGDVVLEVFAALKMNSLQQPQYRDPRDINLTLFGDGRNLASGYSFIFAGWGNLRSAVLKGEEEVVRNPQVRIGRATTANFNFHRHWFGLRVERFGNRVRFLVDDALVGEYTDPDPLTAGRLALWTWNNGLLLARVRVWFQERRPLRDYPAPSLHFLDEGKDEPPAEPILRADFEQGFDGWSDGDNPDGALLERDSQTASQGRWSLKVTAKVSGSSFAVWTGATRFDARRYGTLRFDYRIPPEVKVNLYFKFADEWYAIPFTGGEEHPPYVQVLPPIPGVQADGKWHTAIYPLANFLRAHLKERGREWPEEVWVERLSFASPQRDYLRCGFGGNPYGSSFHIDRFELQQSALVALPSRLR